MEYFFAILATVVVIVYLIIGGYVVGRLLRSQSNYDWFGDYVFGTFLFGVGNVVVFGIFSFCYTVINDYLN